MVAPFILLIVMAGPQGPTLEAFPMATRAVRWDLFRVAYFHGLNVVLDLDYLDNNHIDTALRKIMKELDLNFDKENL